MKKVFLGILLLLSTFTFAQINPILENQYRLAQAYSETGDYAKAEDLLKEILNKDPANQRYIQKMNEVFLKQKKYNESIQFLSEIVSKRPNDLNSYGMLGSTYYQMGEREQGNEIWHSALKSSSTNMVAYRIIANYAIQERAYLVAINMFLEAQARFNNPSLYSYDIGALYSATMKFGEAATEYCKLISYQPGNLETVKGRLNTYLNRAKALDETIEAVDKFQEENENLNILELQAWLYLIKKDYKKSTELIIKNDQLLVKNGSKLYRFAENALSEKAFKTSTPVFDYLIKTYPNSPFLASAQLGYARSLEGLLEEKYIDEQRLWKPYYLPVRVPEEEYLKLASIYEDFTKKASNTTLKARAHFRIGKIQLEKLFDEEKAAKQFDYIAQNFPGTEYGINSYLELAKLNLKHNDIANALQKLELVIRNPRATSEQKSLANFLKAKIDFWSGDFQGSLSKLTKISSNLNDTYANDSIELSMIISMFRKDSLNLVEFAKADFYAEIDSFSLSAEKFKNLSLKENLFILNKLSEYRYCETLLALNQIPLAIAFLEKISQLDDGNIYSDNAKILLANTYFYGIKDYKKAKDNYEELLKLFPNSLFANNARNMINRIEKYDKVNDGI